MDVNMLPPPERASHDRIELEPRAVLDPSGKVTGYVQGGRVLRKTVLERLRFADQITREQLSAGRTLYKAFYYGGMSSKVTLCLTRVHSKGGQGEGRTEAQLDSKAEYDAAMQAIPGELTDLIYDVVCVDLSLAQIAFSRKWGKTTKALALLRLGLDDLGKHYEKQKTS